MELPTRIQAGVTVVRNELPLPPAEPDSDDHHLSAAVDWLCRSQDVTPNGGSAASYNVVLGWEDSYPETTGYIIPTLFSHAAAADSPAIANRAVQMADWLCSIQHSNGSFPSGTGGEGEPSVFNTSQIVFGLVAAYEQTDDRRYKNAVQNACDWLADQQTAQGYWDTYVYKNRVHAYSARIAWALVEGASILPEQENVYRDAARRNCQWVIEQQRPNGWFEKASFESGEAPYLHTIAYTVRGLLECGIALENSTFVSAAKRTADTLLSVQQTDGILKGAYDESWSPAWYHCLTGNAQMAIIWLRLFDYTGEREYQLAARRAIEFLKRRQVLEGQAQVRGALAGSYPLFGPYLSLRFPNWAVKFFADALLLAQDETCVPSTPDSLVESDSEECRVCLLCDGETVERWVADAITQMVEQTNATISLVVINETAGTLGPEKIKRGKKYPSYALYWTANQLLDSRFGDSQYKESVSLESLPCCADARTIRTYPTNVDGLWSELPDEVVDEIEKSSDLVFRRGFGLITGDVLHATEYGVLSYHHGDPRAYRGGPAGFWEYLHDEETAGMMVQLLAEDLDAGEVLAYDEIGISDCEDWGEIRAALYNSSTGLLAKAVENVQRDAEAELEVDEFGKVYTPPNAHRLGQYLRKRGL